MINWLKEHKKGLIRAMFLVPILLVMIISISHVVSWYDIANPFSWAIYLSIAIEIAAMSSIAAASVKVKGGVWIVFIIVTLIQFIGNIFFCYNEINVNTPEFKSWVELTNPIFEALGSDMSDVISQKRWLSLLEGGLLPIISLASLHFFIKYGGIDDVKESKVDWQGTATYVNQNEVETKIEDEIKVENPSQQETTVDSQQALLLNMQKKMGGTDKWS